VDDRAVKRVWWKRRWVVCVALLVALAVAGGLWLASVVRDARAFYTTVHARQIHSALMYYASQHQEQLPSGPEWRQAFLKRSPQLEGLFRSPMADRLHEQSYCIVEGWTETLVHERNINRDEHILVFENPASTDAHELAIVTWSGVSWRLPREVVLRRLAATRTGDGKPVTWEGAH
jgi:hypothetical protein